MLEHILENLIWVALFAGGGIAFWNARAAGLGWEDAKIVGGFGRIMMWSGAIQSAAGFSTIFFYLIVPPLKAWHVLPPDVDDLIHGIVIAAYMVPALGAGVFISIQRWLDYTKDKDTFSAWRALGTSVREIECINDVAAAFSGPPRIDGGGGRPDASPSKDESRTPLLVFLVAGVVVFAGILATYLIVQFYSHKIRFERRSVAPRKHENAVAEVRHRARQIF